MVRDRDNREDQEGWQRLSLDGTSEEVDTPLPSLPLTSKEIREFRALIAHPEIRAILDGDSRIDEPRLSTDFLVDSDTTGPEEIAIPSYSPRGRSESPSTRGARLKRWAEQAGVVRPGTANKIVILGLGVLLAASGQKIGETSRQGTQAMGAYFHSIGEQMTFDKAASNPNTSEETKSQLGAQREASLKEMQDEFIKLRGSAKITSAMLLTTLVGAWIVYPVKGHGANRVVLRGLGQAAHVGELGFRKVRPVKSRRPSEDPLDR